MSWQTLLVSNGVNPKSIGAIARGELATQDSEPAGNKQARRLTQWIRTLK